MTKIISVLNQKGGCSKTTSTIQIGSELKNRGFNVLLIDSDPQGSLTIWAKRAAEVNPKIDELPDFMALENGKVPDNLREKVKAYDYVIIDGSPRIETLMAQTLRVSDLVIVPVNPSMFDLMASGDLVQIMQHAPKVKAAILFTQTKQNSKTLKTARESIKGYGLPVLDAILTQRDHYILSASMGQSIHQTNNSKAITEVSFIVTQLLEVLNRAN